MAPAGTVWKNLRKEYDLSFEEFVNLDNINLKQKLIDINYFVIFIDDLFNSSENYFKIKKKIQVTNFYKNLLKINKTINKTIIVSILYSDKNNPLKFVKSENYEKILLFKMREQYLSLAKKNKNLLFLDIENVFNKYGSNNIYDDRNWYSFRLRINKLGLQLISGNIQDLLENITKPKKKVLVLDCDNTLWGGIVGEDGVEKIEIGTDGQGKAYKDFQRVVKSISDNGVLLCLASKNNEKDVWDVFKNHPEMVIKKKDITAAFINWNDKVDNLKKISKKLNLDLNSFVFIDDNPLERDLIKKTLPQVEVLNMPEDISYWPNYLLKSKLFTDLDYTKEDKNKKKQYLQKLKFDKDLESHPNKKKFLDSLKLNLKIEKLNKYQIARASQMTIKTNQFNFTSKRYSVNDLINYGRKKSNLSYILKLKDNYGDHGYVSLILVSKIKKNYLITNFLTSCRVLGRNVENIFLKRVVKKLSKKDTKIFIEFIKSQKNQLAKNLLYRINLNYLIKRVKKMLI